MALGDKDKDWTLVDKDTPNLTPLGEPDPNWVRGRCPDCGDYLVSNFYYVKGRGYLLVWQCWSAMHEESSCTYQRVL